jgi:hypothetical protein
MKWLRMFFGVMGAGGGHDEKKKKAPDHDACLYS